ncbi:DUF2314 domain-containing protein [Leisingera sp. ANG-Vp]|uniref:DUF2314 domain-containing protein n=1 Tax=Leisingera sp. ANG-Vp TaxID=1577896 RepID=UPI0009E2EEEF|nr:DUF2314 domain-containing protein [Leisingera sp. ANG-Vp]
MIKPLLLSAALALGATAAAAGDPVIQFETSDAEMNAAIASAQGSMDSFFAHVLDSQGKAADGAMVKVALKTSYGHENIWVDQITLAADGGMTGRLANEPNDLPGKHFGDIVNFDRTDLRDWSLFTGSELYGNFTTRVMVPHLDEENRAQMEQLLSKHPLPAGW